jgi:DNA primase large subunit
MAVRRASDPLDERALAGEYPFLPGAEAAPPDEAVSVRALLDEAPYDETRAMGRARIRAAADDPRGERTVEELAGSSADVRVLSFQFARLVLSAAPSNAALRRWAVAEAKRSYARLRRAPAAELQEVARRLGFPLEGADGRFSLGVADYVRVSAPIREADFRLVHQDVKAGRVTVGPDRAARLLQEAVRRALSAPLPLTDEVVRRVRERESELLGELAARLPVAVARSGAVPGGLRPDRFPPCIRKMRRMLERGENLSHSGRFALAAFLHRAGADAETIVDAYRGAPDFDESITRYQVEHITLRDGGRGYEPPECDTLRSHGLCFRDGDPDAAEPADRARDPLCFEERLRHPLQYYRLRGGTVVERDRPEPSETTDRATVPGTSGGRGRTPSTGPR